MEHLTDIFSKHLNAYFVATVLDNGDILQAAVEAGFQVVYGATTSKEDAEACRARFDGHPQIKILHDDDIVLFEALKEINVTCTFCLDTRSEPPPALIQELGVIRHHRIKTHTVLVRNTELFDTDAAGFVTRLQIEGIMRQIDPFYRFVDYGNVVAAVVP